MGWFFTYGSTRKSLIEQLTKSWENDNVKCVCLAKCFRGAIAYSGVLWSVWEITNKSVNTTCQQIKCDLMKTTKDPDGGRMWGNKPLCEESHPYYYSCPIKYLSMVPDVACQEWRDEVMRQFNERRNTRIPSIRY